MTHTRYAAHRGGAALWPENSLLALTRSVALGAPLVEIDVHSMTDGTLAVIHDPTLTRTTDGTGTLADVTYEAFQRLRLRGPDGALSDEHPPVLDDVLALLAPSRTDLLLEIKGPGVPVLYERTTDGSARPIIGPRYEGLEERALAALDARGMRARTNILAFNPAVIERIRAARPSQQATLLVAAKHVELVHGRPEETVDWARAVRATDVGLQYPLVNEAVIRAAHAAGLRVGAWTVNDEADIRTLANLGVDIVTTDRPDIAHRVLGER